MQKIRLCRWIIISALFISNSIVAQLITIPDAQFRIYLVNAGFSGCMTGNSLNVSCPLVNSTTKINLYGYEVQDLTGVEYFSNLDTL